MASCVHRMQNDQRYLSPSLLCVVAIARRQFYQTVPEGGASVLFHNFRVHFNLPVHDFDFRSWVAAQIVKPGWMRIRAGIRGDDNVSIVLLEEAERGGAPRATLTTRRRQQQHRQSLHP